MAEASNDLVFSHSDFPELSEEIWNILEVETPYGTSEQDLNDGFWHKTNW